MAERRSLADRVRDEILVNHVDRRRNDGANRAIRRQNAARAARVQAEHDQLKADIEFGKLHANDERLPASLVVCDDHLVLGCDTCAQPAAGLEESTS